MIQKPLVPKVIYMIPPGVFYPGLCDVCRQPALIKYRDIETNFLIGDCCLTHLIAAKTEIHQSAQRYNNERLV